MNEIYDALYTQVRFKYVAIKNAMVFLSVVLKRGTPVRQWPAAWRMVQASHQAEVRRLLTDLTMSGKVKRRIKGNQFYYSPIEDKKHGTKEEHSDSV